MLNEQQPAGLAYLSGRQRAAQSLHLSLSACLLRCSVCAGQHVGAGHCQGVLPPPQVPTSVPVLQRAQSEQRLCLLGLAEC